LISSSSYHLLYITNFEHPHHAVANARVCTHRTHDVEYSITPLIQTLVIRIGLALRVNLSRITKLIDLDITGYRIKYSTVLWFKELQIRCGRKI
jgi:hypothetical protein